MPTDDPDDPYESTTRWMVEAGRRRTGQSHAQPELPAKGLAKHRPRTFLGVGREIYLFGVLVAAYLNYYFMEVMVEIGALHSVVIFVPTRIPGL